jgi:hypothetical protein
MISEKSAKMTGKESCPYISEPSNECYFQNGQQFHRVSTDLLPSRLYKMQDLRITVLSGREL